MNTQLAISIGGVDETEHYWSIETDELFRVLQTRTEGLSAEQAQQRLKRCGSNEIVETREHGVSRLLWRQFESPLVLILVFGALVSFAMRDWIEAIIILVIVLGSSLLGFIQEFRASSAIAALKNRLALSVRVRRDGVVDTVKARELVPGDIVELAAGNLVPADGVILSARDFLVSEATLTGESFPVEKHPGTSPSDATLSKRSNCAFLGTSVRSGTATMLIVQTGRNTALGAIALKLSFEQEETEFSRGLRQFGHMLMRVMVLMVVFVLAVNQLLGRSAIDSMLFAVALAVGLSPELLPAIVSVTLSRGARAMAQRGVIVRKLDAIENLGAMDVFCTDKTGTLTHGVIDLDGGIGVDGEVSDEVLRWAHLNATFETGIENPIDQALIKYGEQRGMGTVRFEKVDEIPYDFIRKRLTIAARDIDQTEQHVLISKGAFTNILDVCTHVSSRGAVSDLDATARSALESIYRGKGEEGYRVLGVAIKQVAAQSHYSRSDESEMIFLGFLLFFDPPKAEAAKTIVELASLGIRIKVITGDNQFVAAHVASTIGLNPKAMLTGQEIAAMHDEALWHHVDKTDLFVEVDPQQKEKVVRALQRNGHAVGYLGDGINDAPALKAADVGISVDQAVDVARESADVILLRPDLEVLRWGVEEGRRTFANTLKYIGITISANFGNMISMALVTPAMPFLPLAAKQILLNNFLSDVPSLTIASDNVDADLIRQPQRWNAKAVRRFMVIFGLISTVFDLITFAVLLFVYRVGEKEFQTAWFTVSLLTELLVVLILRTRLPAWRSRPSPMLLWSTCAVLIAAVALPLLPFMRDLFGFVRISGSVMILSVLIVVGYALATEVTKRWVFNSTEGRSRLTPSR